MTVLVLASDGPMLFEDDEQAAAYMEPIDVRNGEYQVFDSTGQVRRLIIVKTRTTGAWSMGGTEVESVRIGEGEERLTDTSQASEAMVSYLSRVHGIAPSAASFSELVALLHHHDGFVR